MISDMIRGMIVVKHPEDLPKVYKILQTLANVTIIRIKNKLNFDLQNVTLNYIYGDQIIGEIQIRCGSRPVNFYANHFYY